MAFENVFKGIDHQAGQKMDMARQNQFMQMLGQGIATAERAEERDIRNRQLDIKQSQLEAQKASNYKQVAMDELNRINMGGQPTPQGQAALKVMEQTSAPKVYFDPVSGQQVMQPSPWQSMGGVGNVGAKPQSGTSFFEEGSIPRVNASDLIVGGLPMDAQIDAMALPQAQTPVGPVMRPDMNTAQMNIDALSQPAMDIPQYKAGGILEGTPKGLLMEEESRQKLSDARAAEEMKRSIKGTERFGSAQLEAANFANRMVESTGIIEDILGEDPEARKGMTGGLGITKQVLDVLPLGDFGSGLGEVAVHFGATPEQQQYMNAAENWLSANLRKESGAVISPSEMAQEYKKYFPMPSDSEPLIEQKSKLREQTAKGMIAQSAGAYQEAFGRKAKAVKEKSRPVSYQEYFK